MGKPSKENWKVAESFAGLTEWTDDVFFGLPEDDSMEEYFNVLIENCNWI